MGQSQGLLPNAAEEVEIMQIWQRIKKSFQAYLAKMAKANKETFGGKALDCCSLNRPNTAKKSS